MSDFLKRLRKEQQELETKAFKLKYFIDNNDAFYELSDANQILLQHQVQAMGAYNDILLIRLELLRGSKL